MKMLRCIAVLLMLAASASHAQSVKLADHEISALLSGNTALGIW